MGEDDVPIQVEQAPSPLQIIHFYSLAWLLPFLKVKISWPGAQGLRTHYSF